MFLYKNKSNSNTEPTAGNSIFILCHYQHHTGDFLLLSSNSTGLHIISSHSISYSPFFHGCNLHEYNYSIHDTMAVSYTPKMLLY
jgi:hypothetical protein